jgi:AcrR family transcriptional regulator
VPHVSVTERRPQLIRAAIEVMTRDGVAAASTRAIAAELGIAQAMVHYVYGSKDELYRAVIEQLTADVTEQVRANEFPSGADFRAMVQTYAQGLWRTVVADIEHFQLLNELVAVGLRTPSLRPAIADYQRRLDQAFEASLRDAAERVAMTLAGDVQDVARFFFAGVDGLLLHRLLRQEEAETDERTLNAIVEATTALAEGRLSPASSSVT